MCFVLVLFLFYFSFFLEKKFYIFILKKLIKKYIFKFKLLNYLYFKLEFKNIDNLKKKRLLEYIIFFFFKNFYYFWHVLLSLLLHFIYFLCNNNYFFFYSFEFYFYFTLKIKYWGLGLISSELLISPNFFLNEFIYVIFYI